MLLVFGALAFRVAQLQVFSGDRYRLKSLSQTVHTIPLTAQRGSIFDRDGRDLALSIELSSVYADPQTRGLDPVVYASQLAPILHVSERTLRDRMSERKFEFVYLARRVSDHVVAQVRKLELLGVGFVPESARQYPAGVLAGSLVGDVGGEVHGITHGLSGLEALYERMLRGKPGELRIEKDQQGIAIPNTAKDEIEARRGTDIVLTLDEPLQWQTEQSLMDEVTATGAKGGMAVVVDVTTGDVLALASIDGATPKVPAHPSGPNEATRPLMDLFEPGSTNKLITLSTAIENGFVGPDTLIDVPSVLQIGHTTFKDVDVHGDVRMSVTDILRQSSNIGTIKIAEHMSKEQLAEALRSFGLGARTGVDFPGQPSGLLLDPDHYYDTGLASTAIGYGVAVTGMQMLDAYVTIANDGVTRPPHLLAAEIDPKGVRHAADVIPGRRVVSSQTASTMTGMLTDVVSHGTGACAAVPGYTIAGKTGTARKAVNGGYSTGTMASFIGYAPAAHPKLATLVVLDEPASQYGGTAAAPVFADVMQFALTRNNVAPDDVANAQFDAARASAAATGTACTDPAAAMLNHEALIAAQAAAAPKGAGNGSVPPPAGKTALTSTDTSSDGGGTSSRRGKGTPVPAGTLSGNTSQSG